MYSILSNLIQRKTMVGVCPKSFAPGNEKLRDPEVPLPRFLLFYPRKTKAKKTSRKEKKTNKKGGDFKSEGHFAREQVGSREGREAARTSVRIRPAQKKQIIEAQPRNLSIQAFQEPSIDLARRESPGFNKWFFRAESNLACLSSKSMA